MSTLSKAEEISHIAYEGRKDKGITSKTERPPVVMPELPTEDARIVALLHDAIDDAPEAYGFERLKSEGFSEPVIAALEAITRNEDENYWDYLRRVADNDLAIDVMLAKLVRDSESDRRPSHTAKDAANGEQNRKASAYLSDIKAFKASTPDIDLTKEPFKYILHRKLYAVLRDDYTAMCSALTQVLEAVSKPVCPTAIIQGRAKKLDSFTEKCARKAKKYGKRSFAMMTDLCGARVVLHTTGQVAEFCELIKQVFDIDWANSEDAGSRLGNDRIEVAVISVPQHPGEVA